MFLAEHPNRFTLTDWPNCTYLWYYSTVFGYSDLLWYYIQCQNLSSLPLCGTFGSCWTKFLYYFSQDMKHSNKPKALSQGDSETVLWFTWLYMKIWQYTVHLLPTQNRKLLFPDHIKLHTQAYAEQSKYTLYFMGYRFPFVTYICRIV